LLLTSCRTPNIHPLHFGFQQQGGWKELLGRFDKGGGHVLDIEFLTNEKGMRVAAFGFMAGFAGAAASIMAYDLPLLRFLCANVSKGSVLVEQKISSDHTSAWT
jgi:hypothetical protein